MHGDDRAARRRAPARAPCSLTTISGDSEAAMQAQSTVHRAGRFKTPCSGCPGRTLSGACHRSRSRPDDGGGHPSRVIRLRADRARLDSSIASESSGPCLGLQPAGSKSRRPLRPQTRARPCGGLWSGHRHSRPRRGSSVARVRELERAPAVARGSNIASGCPGRRRRRSPP